MFVSEPCTHIKCIHGIFYCIYYMSFTRPQRVIFTHACVPVNLFTCRLPYITPSHYVYSIIYIVYIITNWIQHQQDDATCPSSGARCSCITSSFLLTRFIFIGCDSLFCSLVFSPRIDIYLTNQRKDELKRAENNQK